MGALEPVRVAADHDQMGRCLLEIKDRLVGQIGRGIEARDRRHEGGRAGRYHEAAGFDQHGRILERAT